MAEFQWDLSLFEDWNAHLQTAWGLDPRFSPYPAAAQTWLQQTGRRPVVITSGYRDPEKQLQLLSRWDAGDRSGLVTKPSRRSWHMQGLALDVSTLSEDFYYFRDAMVYWGCRWGGWFKKSDPVHFDLPIPPQKSIAQLIIG